MAFEYLTNLPLEEAKRLFLEALAANGFTPGTERVSVPDACGRVTAAAV